MPRPGSITLRPKDIPEHVRERLLKTAVERAPSGCLLWTGAKFSNGYGMVWLREPYGRPHGTHRVAYVIHKGTLNPGMVVRHNPTECTSKLCVEGGHLLLGTQKTNVREYWLLESEGGKTAALIRERFAAGESLHALGAEYGIEREKAGDIVYNRLYYDDSYNAPTPDPRDSRLHTTLKLDRQALDYASAERRKGRIYAEIAAELGVSMSTLWEALNGRCARS